MDSNLSAQEANTEKSKKRDVIPFSRPPEINLDEVRDDFNRILKSGSYVNGQFARELEDTVREFYMSKYCISFSTGTAALWWAVYAIKHLYLKNKPKPKCVIPSFTWSSTFFALAPLGCEKVTLKDISLDSWLMESTEDEAEPDLVIPVTTFGNNYRKNLRYVFPGSNIILDCTHNLGGRISKYDEYEAAVFSLAATKNIPGADGGLLITDDLSITTAVVEGRNRYNRITEFSAVLALKNWQKSVQLLKKKEEAWSDYASKLQKYKFQKCNNSTYSVCACLLDKSSQPVIDALVDEIELKRYYQPIKEGLPTTDDVYRRIICLPTHEKADRDYIIKRVLEVAEKV